MTEETVILVNEKDEELGLAEKIEAHRQGLLHRAFSVVLFHRERPEFTLLQQRAAGKYHCPLMWANACCSHPRQKESPLTGAQRRLREELGIDAPMLIPAGSFVYRAQVGELIEHEVDHVFAGMWGDVEIPINNQEVATTEWVRIETLLHTPDRKIVPWFTQALYKALATELSPIHADILQQQKRAAA